MNFWKVICFFLVDGIGSNRIESNRIEKTQKSNRIEFKNGESSDVYIASNSKLLGFLDILDF